MTFTPQMGRSRHSATLANDLEKRHRDSMLASLNHRLEMAHANQDARLIELLERERREITAETPIKRLTQRLQDWWQGVQVMLAQRSQLRVSEMRDNDGQRWWRAYDPSTGHEVYTDSQTELMLWVEQHYQGR